MSYTDSQNIQYKASTGQVNLDQAQGIVECFVAGIGNKDSVGDVCATGAFAKSLLRRKPRVVWGHNWNDPIGKVLEMYEVPPNDPRLPAKMRSAGIGGLYAKVQFNLNSEKGKEAFANVAFFGEEQEWSIGYKTLRAQFDQGSQANILYEVELYEVSPVLHGANQLTGTISVKNADGNTPMMMPAMQGMPNIPEDEVQRKLQEELSLQTGSKVNISSVEDGEVTFTMGEKGEEESYKCHFRNDNGVFMFSNPQRINKPMQMPSQMQPMMPMGMPSRPMVPQNPNQTVVVPQVLPGGMPNQMPLVQIDYVGEDSSSKPQGKPKLVQEEADLAEALIKITKRHGKFNEDANGVWAGYKPAAENMVAKIGVKCSNCVMYEGNGVCKIIALKVEDGGKCRFAVIPEGVVKVSPIKKQEVTEEMQEEEVKWLKEIEDKYPEVFIKGDLRHAVKSKRDALTASVKLTRIDEYSVKSASNEIYYLPVTRKDAFETKQAIDPIIDYYRAEAYVDDGGIVFTSGVNKDFAEAVNNAVKALGRNLAGRTARAGRGMAARFNPKAWDGDNDGLVQEGTPYQRPAIPGINDFGTRGVVDAARATAAFKKPKGASKKPVADRRGLSSGKRDLSRHSNRDRDLEKQFPNAEENAKREAHDKLIDAWEAGMDMSFTTIGRQQDERGGRFSEDFLRGRELGYNDARSRWYGKGTAEQPKDFDPKAKASGKYSSWYRDVVSQLGRGKANRPEDADREQQYAGIDAGMKEFLMSVAPDTSNWAEEDRASLAKLENDYGFGRGGLSSGMGFDKFGNIPAKPKNNRRTVDPSLRNTSKNRAMMTAERRLEEMANSGDAEYDSIMLRAREALSNEGVPGYKLTNEYGEPNSLVAQKMQEILAADIQRGSLSSGKKPGVRDRLDEAILEGKLPKSEWTKTQNGFEMDAPDIDGMYQINNEGNGKYSITRFSDMYRNGGQNALDEDIDKTFNSPSAAKKWAEKDYNKIIENMSGPEDYVGGSSSLSSGRTRDSYGNTRTVEEERAIAAYDEAWNPSSRNALDEISRSDDVQTRINVASNSQAFGETLRRLLKDENLEVRKAADKNIQKRLNDMANEPGIERRNPRLRARKEFARKLLAEHEEEMKKAGMRPRGSLSSGRRMSPEQLKERLKMVAALPDHRKDEDYIKLSSEDKKYADVIEKLISDGTITSDNSWYDYSSNSARDEMSDAEIYDAVYGGMPSGDELDSYASGVDFGFESSGSRGSERDYSPSSDEVEEAYISETIDEMTGEDFLTALKQNMTPEQFEKAIRDYESGATRGIFVPVSDEKSWVDLAEEEAGNSPRELANFLIYRGVLEEDHPMIEKLRNNRTNDAEYEKAFEMLAEMDAERGGLSSGRRDLGMPFSSWEELSDDERSDIEQAYFADNPGSERPGSRDYDSDAAQNDFEMNPAIYGYSANFRRDAINALKETGISGDEAGDIVANWEQSDAIHDRYLRNSYGDTLGAMISAYDDYLDRPYGRGGLSSGRNEKLPAMPVEILDWSDLTDDERSEFEQDYFADNPGSERPGSRDYDPQIAQDEWDERALEARTQMTESMLAELDEIERRTGKYPLSIEELIKNADNGTVLDYARARKQIDELKQGRRGLSSGRGIDPSLGDPANITPEEAAARTDDIGANFRYLFVSPDAVAFKYNGKMREIRAESDNGIYDSLRRSKAGALYFGGIDSESGEYRTFRLDRIEGLIPGASRQSTSSGPYSRAGMSSGRRGLSSGYNMPDGVYESDIPGWDDPEPDYDAVNDWEWDELPADVTDEINKDIEEYILNRDKSAPDNVAREIDKDGNLGIDDKTTIIEQDGIKYVANPARSQADILEQILASNMVRYTKAPDKKKLLESMSPWRGYVQGALDGGQLTDEEAEKLYGLLDGIESEIKDPSNTPFDAINRALKDIEKIVNDADKRWRDSTGADPSDEVFIKGWRKLYSITQDGPRNAGRGVDQNSIYRLMDNWQDARYRGKISDDGKYEIEDLNSFAKNVINGGELDYEVDDEGFTRVSDPAYFISDFDKFAAQGYSTGFSSGRRGMSSGRVIMSDGQSEISFDEEDGDGIYDATRDGYSIVRNEGGGGGSYRRRFPESTATYGGSGLTGAEQEEIRAVLKDSPDPFIQSLLLPDRRGRMRTISDKQWKILKDRADKKKKLSARPSGFTSTARSGGTIAPGGRPTGKDIDITPADITDEATFKQMVDKAMFDGNVIRFNYNGKERQIIPVNIEKNQKTGKLNMTGQGLDGVRKLFSFDKIEPPTERSGSLSSGRRGMSSGRIEDLPTYTSLDLPSYGGPRMETYRTSSGTIEYDTDYDYEDRIAEQLDTVESDLYDQLQKIGKIGRQNMGNEAYLKEFGGAVPAIEEIMKNHDGENVSRLDALDEAIDRIESLKKRIASSSPSRAGMSSGRRGMSSGLKFEPTGDAYKRIDANNESSLRDAALQVTEIEDPKIEKMIGDFPTDEIRDYQLAQLEHALKVREDIAKALSEKYPNTVRNDIATVYDYGDFDGGPLSEDAIYDLDTLNDFINSIIDEIKMFEDIHDRKSDELEEMYDLVSGTSRGLESAKLELESSRMDLDEGDIELDEYTKLVEEINSRIDELSQQLEEYEDNAEELEDEVREAGFFGDGEMYSRASALENSYMNFRSISNPRSARRTGLSSGRREMMQDTIAADENSARRESLLDADMPETDRMYSSFMSRPSSERASAFASYRRETGKSPNPNDPSFRRWIAGLESDLIMREDSGEMSGRDSGRGLSSGSKRKKG